LRAKFYRKDFAAAFSLFALFWRALAGFERAFGGEILP